MDSLTTLDHLFTFKDPLLQIPKYRLNVKTINNEVANLELEVREFCSQDDLQGTLTINKARLRSLVVSYRHDLNRHRAFHLEDSYPDEYKQAAYFAYWFSKVKPINLLNANYFFKYLAINELFAVHVTLRMLNIQPKQISNEQYRNFVRQLYYRNTDPKQLYYALELFNGVQP